GRQFDRGAEWLRGIELDAFGAQREAPTFHREKRLTKTGVDVCINDCTITLEMNSKRGIMGRLVPGATQIVHRKPVFHDVLNAMRSNELVFHLRFKAATLKLNILVTSISQLVDPDVAVVVSAPGPGLLAGQFTM